MVFNFDPNMMQQQMNNMAVNQEIVRICTEHVGCVGCPLKDSDLNIQGTVVTCETAKMKGETQ